MMKKYKNHLPVIIRNKDKRSNSGFKIKELCGVLITKKIKNIDNIREKIEEFW
jgi:hypothetical protein